MSNEPCQHENTRPKYDHVVCKDCGSVCPDSGWGVAQGHWFASVVEARFYRDNGRLPERVLPEADRLSTPAASTGDAAARFDALDRIKPSAADSSESFRWNCECVSADEAREIIDQLQARNAEQAFALERSREAHADMELRYLTMRTKLTALLDGIEGLEKRYLDRVIDHVARSEKTSRIADSEWEAGAGSALGIVAKELKALRESSVPAIGGEDG